MARFPIIPVVLLAACTLDTQPLQRDSGGAVPAHTHDWADLTGPASGRVGIGTTTPRAALDVTGGGVVKTALDIETGGCATPNKAVLAGAPDLSAIRAGDVFLDEGGWPFSIESVDDSTDEIHFTGTCREDGSNDALVQRPALVADDGAVGIGTAAPGAALTVLGGFVVAAPDEGNHAIGLWNQATGRKWNLYQLGAVGPPAHGFLLEHFDGTDYSTPLVIDEAGRLGLGTTAPTERLYVAGNIYAEGVLTQGSSRSLKQDIRPLDAREATAAVMALEPTRFRYKADPSDEQVGFIAEDVPELVATKDRRGVAPTDIAAVLTSVVQEQQRQLAAQERRIADLERRLARLEHTGRSRDGAPADTLREPRRSPDVRAR